MPATTTQSALPRPMRTYRVIVDGDERSLFTVEATSNKEARKQASRWVSSACWGWGKPHLSVTLEPSA